RSTRSQTSCVYRHRPCANLSQRDSLSLCVLGDNREYPSMTSTSFCCVVAARRRPSTERRRRRIRRRKYFRTLYRRRTPMLYTIRDAFETIPPGTYSCIFQGITEIETKNGPALRWAFTTDDGKTISGLSDAANGPTTKN